MPLKSKRNQPVQKIDRMAKARAAKVAKAAQRAAASAAPSGRRAVPEPDFDPAYAGNYGDAAQPLERRRVGTQPNSRARNAVERAQERMQQADPRRRGPAPQMPGMDIGYHADRDLVQPTRPALDDDPDSLGDGEEVLATPEMEPAPRQARVSSIGRRTMEHRLPQRAPIRRTETGRILVQARDGRLVSRTSFTSGDKFDVPFHFIPEGWTYQWLSQATVGKPNNNAHFYANGWEPVPAARHDGVYMMKGHDGPIIVDDMILVERRVELTLEARAEEIKAAKQLLRTQNEQFQPRLPDARRHRGTAARIKREIEPMPSDIGRPSLVVDDGSYEV